MTNPAYHGLYHRHARLPATDSPGQGTRQFRLDEDHMLIVASDRLSAFDVVLPDPVPGKGALLTKVSNFWFDKTSTLSTTT